MVSLAIFLEQDGALISPLALLFWGTLFGPHLCAVVLLPLPAVYIRGARVQVRPDEDVACPRALVCSEGRDYLRRRKEPRDRLQSSATIR